MQRAQDPARRQPQADFQWQRLRINVLKSATPPPFLASLTERQRDVFRLLAEGCATKTIARRLDLSVGTVKVHLAAIYRLLGAHSRMQAMAKAFGGFAVPPKIPTLAAAAAAPAVIIPPRAGQDLSSGR